MKRFKSGKQRRAELRAARQRRQMRLASREVQAASPAPWRPTACVAVDPSRLRPNNSYSEPDFVARGYYRDLAFRCIDCGAEGVWTAERQRWWYEVAGGDVFTTARRCAHCRAVERQRKEAARQSALAGRLRQLAKLAGHRG
ncbi:MAG TPA: zinc-ribbon domain containing protein [Azonexus sp.]|nr:zinc-ribbon domain containing protein [Azonexus sp.]